MATIGNKTVVFTAVDNAGNSYAKNCTYHVNFNFTGFFQPVDNCPPGTRPTRVSRSR